MAAVIALAASREVWPSPPPAQNAAPVRIVLGWAGDPATSQAVTWRTADPVASPQAQIGLAAAGCGGTTGPARTVTAAPRTVKLGKGRVVTHYKAEFNGLTPSTRYAYRVGSGSSFSNWHCFITASLAAAPFRFIYLGDAQNGLERKWPRGCAGGVCRGSRCALRRARGRPGGTKETTTRSGANGWRASVRGRRRRLACPLLAIMISTARSSA